jgi:uncharacterized protein YcbK (DUF882 family)
LFNPKNGHKETIQYRLRDGSYPLAAREQIDRVFGLNKTDSIEHISLRLIALLDHIQDHYGKGKQTIRLDSAYRSPTSNKDLRDQGRIVAKASTHMEGMAVDITIAGVSGKHLWKSLREKNCCGVGWYGKHSVHVDTGPARFWTGATSKVKTDISEHNKKILLRTDRDIYLVDEEMELFITRITEYPIGVHRDFHLVTLDENGNERKIDKFRPNFPNRSGGTKGSCVMIQKREDARQIRWQIPKAVGTRQVAPAHIRIDFCNKTHQDMPDYTLSNRIEVR